MIIEAKRQLWIVEIVYPGGIEHEPATVYVSFASTKGEPRLRVFSSRLRADEFVTSLHESQKARSRSMTGKEIHELMNNCQINWVELDGNLLGPLTIE
jgi:hypothetical protein